MGARACTLTSPIPIGLLVSLDFFLPSNALLRSLYLGYLYAQGVFWGFLLHGRPRVYTYIPDSDRTAGKPGLFSAFKRAAPLALSRLSLRARCVLGLSTSWAPARVHLHPRFRSDCW